MNEMTFRNKLLTNPKQLDEEMLAFIADNPQQKKRIKQARELDEQISQTLDIDVPEGLHARILLNQSYQQDNQTQQNSLQASESGATENNRSEVMSLQPITPQIKKRFALWLKGPYSAWFSGIAATAFAFVILFSVLQTHHGQKPLSGEAMVAHILAHIAEDPSLMTAVKLPESQQEMQQLFASVGAQLNKPVEGMSYAGICDVEGQKGLHIVMQEKGEPITIIVMPGQQVTATQAFQKSGYHGELMPVKGGMVAIVANTEEQVALAQIRFFKAVKFT